MIIIVLSDDGKDFRVFNPDTKEDITKDYQCNVLTIQTVDGKWVTGFHVGADCTEDVLAAEALDA